MKSKVCTKCKTEKSVSEFHRRSQSPDGLRSRCKVCVARYHATPEALARKKELAARPEAKAKAISYRCDPVNMQRAKVYRRHARKDKALEFGRKIKWKFGLSIDDYNRLLSEQGGFCAICRLPPSANNKRLAIDHCHDTGVVRGLLCHPCNAAIGLLKEDVQRILAASAYVARHKPETTAL